MKKMKLGGYFCENCGQCGRIFQNVPKPTSRSETMGFEHCWISMKNGENNGLHERFSTLATKKGVFGQSSDPKI